MLEINLYMYHATAFAAIVLLLGRFFVSKVPLLRNYCIPAPVVGGIVYALVHLGLYAAGIATISFDGTLQSFFMTVFFCSVGFMASFKLLKKGGIQVVIFLVVSIVLVLLQDVLGTGMAAAFGLDPRLGLCIGSIPMVGGHGTAGSFGPLIENLGVTGAATVAIAAATFGLVAGSMLGGPIASARIKKHGLHSTENAVSQDDQPVVTTQAVENDRFLNAALYFAIAIGLGAVVSKFIQDAGLTMPSYIGAMLVAAVIRNIVDAAHIEAPMVEIDALGNLSLSLFLAMALMALKLWQLADLAIPMIVMLLAQTVLMAIFTYFVVFNVMGRDYEAAVFSSATCGFGMGATPNAMANMQAVANKYGPAPRAFFVVPLVGSLFIDFFNSMIITAFLSFLG